jgi:hypothetical protein
MRPHDLPPAAVLGARHQHGSRIRYIGGCRCKACRKANSSYENERARARRQGDFNGIVDAAPARTHIFRVARSGVGFKTVADSDGLSRTIVAEIKAGTKQRIRARTLRRILAVGTAQRPDSALVSARSTWRLLRKLMEEGFTRTHIARQLGSKAKTPALQIRHDRVTVKTRAAVVRVYRSMTE